MAAIPSIIGMAGGAQGSGFAAPSGVSQQQLDTAYNQTQDAIQQQQQFVNALNAQNGLQNQNTVFNTLNQVSQGKGPNPAQAMLNQATGQNVANQAALMAGQRGSSSNVGMMARQAAQQGASTQQQAAGQAATLQSNQQLNALGQMGGMANTMVANQQQGIAQLSNQGLQQQANLMGLQGNVNSANAGLTQARMTQQGQMLGNMMNAAGAAAMLAAAEGGQVPSKKMMADGGDPSFGPMASGYIPAPAPMIMPPPPPAVAAAPMVNNSFSQAPVQTSTAPAPTSGPKSKVGQFFKNMQDGKSNSNLDSFASGQAGTNLGMGIGHLLHGSGNKSQNQVDAMNAKSEQDLQDQLLQHGDYEGKTQDVQDGSQQPDMSVMAAKGGKVPALVSPGEVYLPPKEVKEVAKGKNPMKAGEKIPGKPVVPGAVNSYANDIVPKKLQEGGIIIPRSITQGPNPHWNAMKFVHATLAKNKKIPKKV